MKESMAVSHFYQQKTNHDHQQQQQTCEILYGKMYLNEASCNNIYFVSFGIFTALTV
jgi:hypothetical protein